MVLARATRPGSVRDYGLAWSKRTSALKTADTSRRIVNPTSGASGLAFNLVLWGGVAGVALLPASVAVAVAGPVARGDLTPDGAFLPLGARLLALARAFSAREPL
jgi:hypothetical protein